MSKKIKIILIIIIYLFGWLYQSREAGFKMHIFANEKKPVTHIVALLVDNTLYQNSDFKSSLTWYTTQYIQSKITNSRAVVFPIATDTIMARDIAKMLENLYYDGVEQEPSQLDGVILVGDKVALPIINDNGAIFASIYPYVDFDNPKFYWDPTTQYFIANKNNKAQADIRHSIINVGNEVSDYIDFFDHLKSYAAQPSSYVSNAIWYDDLIDQKLSYDDLTLDHYINNMLFAEDLGYHRYNPLLVDILNTRELNGTMQTLNDLSQITGETGSYDQHIGNVFADILASGNLIEQSQSMETPALMVADMLKGFQTSYPELYGVSARARARDNILAAGRWTGDKIDDHSKKIVFYDSLYTKTLGSSAVPSLVELNKVLQDRLTNAVNANHYALHVAIPENAQILKNVKAGVWEGLNQQALQNISQGGFYPDGIYEAFFYGRNVSTITGLDQTTIFLGSDNPLHYSVSNLSTYPVQHELASVGVSQGILSQLVEANRGYNFNLSQSDAANFQAVQDMCGDDEPFNNYVLGYLGGNTPLNLTGDGSPEYPLQLIDQRYDRGGLSNWILEHPEEIEDQSQGYSGAILDVAGSRRIPSLEAWMDPNQLNGGYLQKVAGIKTLKIGPIYTAKWIPTNTCDLTQIASEPLDHHNIYTIGDLNEVGYEKTFRILQGTTPVILYHFASKCPNNPILGSACYPLSNQDPITNDYIQKQTINYKTINSVVVHDSPTPDQTSQLAITTNARPIDSVRTISFKGLGGDRVGFEYPNLYAVDVYKADSEVADKYILKTPSEIEASIYDYLHDMVDHYNAILSTQLTKRSHYYQTNSGLFDKLGAANNLASPNRSYTLLSNDFFTTLIPQSLITAIAQMLYVENSMVPYKFKSENLASDYEQYYSIANVTHKKDIIIHNYLTQHTPASPLQFPDYISNGYELIALTSDGDDSINSDRQADRLLELQQRINDYNNYQNTYNKRDDDEFKYVTSDTCASQYGDPVPLVDFKNMSFPWFKAFSCWLEHISAPHFEFRFDNAMGPVFVSDIFKNFTKTGDFEQYSIELPDVTILTPSEEDLLKNLDISLSNISFSLESNVPNDLRPHLLITQRTNPVPLNIRISSTGDVCTMIEDTNTCVTDFVTTTQEQNYISPYLVPKDPITGVSHLHVQICSNEVCPSQTLSLFITPGELDHAQIHLPYNDIVSMSQIPITISVYDKFNNKLDRSYSPLLLTTSTGSFAGGATGYSFGQVNDIANLASPATDGREAIHLELSSQDDGVISSQNFTVSSGTLVITSPNATYDTTNKAIDYTLANKKSYIYLNNDNINIGLLPQLTLQLQGPQNNNLAGAIVAYSEQGRFRIYENTTNTTSVIANSGLTLTNTLIFDGDHSINLVLQPQLDNSAGDDKLIFQFPDGHEEIINVTIRAAQEASQLIAYPHPGEIKKLYNNNTDIPLSIKLLDDRGNQSLQTQTLRIDSFGPLHAPNNSILMSGGLIETTISTDDLGGIGYIRVRSNQFPNIIPALRSAQVKQSIIPTENINGLYLSLLGTNRGNTIDNTQDYYNFIPQILRSSKVLSVTSELSDPSTIGISLLEFGTNGILRGNQADHWKIGKQGQRFVLLNPEQQIQVTLPEDISLSPQSSSTLSTYNSESNATNSYSEATHLYLSTTWSAGSSNAERIYSLIDTTQIYNPTTNGSVEQANNPEKNIGRRSSQQHLVQFGQGESVGVATQQHSSEFLINYGDPLISRVTRNPDIPHTNISAGPGQRIVNSSDKTILKALSIDVNNDGLEDVVTVYTDGTVERSKQYGGFGGGDPIFIEMGPLLQLYGGIKDVFGADTMGNGYGDIIVQTSNDDIRIYTNTNGIYDVDGYPACINPTQKDGLPQRVDTIDQWFIEDMDKDGIADFITNQNGQIHIIYGGKSGNSYSYISDDHAHCDNNRQTRQAPYKKLIDHIGVQLFTGSVVDNSLIRWKGLVMPSDDGSALAGQLANIFDEDQYNTNTVPDFNSIPTRLLPQVLDNISTSDYINMPDFNDFPLEDITNSSLNDLLRRSVSPFPFYPSYETINADDIRYITTSQLIPHNDKLQVTKHYENLSGTILSKGDLVKVSVRIEGIRNEPLTYIDRIDGPWEISMEDGIISGWEQGTLPSSAIYHGLSPQNGFFFLVDNITLGAANVVEFSYTLRFQGGSAIKIDLSDRNNDGYTDISVYPLDACAQFLWTYTNTAAPNKHYREYIKEFVDVGAQLNAYSHDAYYQGQNFIAQVGNEIKDAENSEFIQTVLEEFNGEGMSFHNLFDDGGVSVNIDLGYMTHFNEEINTALQHVLDSLCRGKTTAIGSGGLPIPFNMAFLSPGVFNIMGCVPKMGQIDNIFPKDGGMPIFAFPATFYAPSPTGPVPIPLPFPFGGIFKGAQDSYGYFGFPLDGGKFSSQIRIYLSPTLTGKLGYALCMGSQKTGMKWPEPFNNITGNCYVSVLNSGGDNTISPDYGDIEHQLSDSDMKDLSQFGQCLDTIPRGNATQANPDPSHSPFHMVGINQDGHIYNVFPPGTYFGVINFEKTPIFLGDLNGGAIDTGAGILFKGGQEVKPQLQGGKAAGSGLLACIVDNRMDRQINYIVNNFTNMQIGIYLPDISQLATGFDKMSVQMGVNTSTQSNQTPGTDSIAQIRNSMVNQSQLNNLSTSVNNPFETIEKLFEQTPLININTQDIVVDVPMIYSEDITKFQSQMESRKERNAQISQDRLSLIQGVFGVCVAAVERDFDPNAPAPTGSSNSPLNPNAITQVGEDIQTRQTQLEDLLQEAHSCEIQGRDDPQCNQLKIDYHIVSAEDGNQFIKRLQGIQSKLGLCFDIFGGNHSSQISTIVTISTQTATLSNRINENIRVLDQYKRFPLQLYDWVHVTDRYLNELASMVNDFLGYINHRLNLNATRFEQYVDAIITMSLALETRQAIINLSTDRQKKCSTCTVDSYDAYACSLGSFCDALQLPILKLPPFKIPNIYIDLSHIDLGMDILLPKFQFRPVSVELPELPDLPQPPSIILPGDLLDDQVLDQFLKEFMRTFPAQIPLSVPSIPLLPPPPQLPVLPSYIPQIKMELPVLPPAPKIPRIAPSLEAAIKGLSFFVNLYCIVKNNLGLVAENNVKTRIEQLTQRNYEIGLFDTINLTKDMSYEQDKLVGFDFEIDAYLNFKMNFNEIYQFIADIADQVNMQTRKLISWNANSRIATDKFKEQVDMINNSTQQNIDLSNPFGYQESDDKSLVVLDEQRNDILAVTNFLKENELTPLNTKEQLQDRMNRIQQYSTFIPQQDSLTRIQQELQNQFTSSQQGLDVLGQQLQNYDQFLDKLSRGQTEYTIYSGNQNFSAQLFENTSTTKLPERSLIEDYVAVQKKLLSNYDKGLVQVDTSSKHDDITKVRNEIAYLSQGLDILKSFYGNTPDDPQELYQLQQEYDNQVQFDTLKYNYQAMVCSDTSPTSTSLLSTTNTNTTEQQLVLNAYPDLSLTAQVGGGTSPSPTTSSNLSSLYDFSEYGSMVMFPYLSGGDTYYVDAVQSDYFTQRQKGYHIVDMNGDKKDDILMWDNSQVWISYGAQNSGRVISGLHKLSTKAYVAPLWASSTTWEDHSDKNGYVSVGGLKLKLSSPDWAVKNLRTTAQDYDSFTVSWTNSSRQNDVDAYILELTRVPDMYHLKAHQELPANLQSRYVLLLPEESYSQEGYLSLVHQLASKKLSSLLGNELIDIVSYNSGSQTLNYSFTTLERHWYYVRVASIQASNSTNPIYTLSSPRSHHVVAGPQLIADEDGPISDIQLIREKNNTTISEGNQLFGLVNTTYRLEVNRDDPSGIASSEIQDSSGNNLVSSTGSHVLLSGLYFELGNQHHYILLAHDNYGNTTTDRITLTIGVPSIQIQDIIESNIPAGGLNIIAQVSQGMDDGLVKFQRLRNNTRSDLPRPTPTTLSLSESSPFLHYPLGFNQTIITGGVYNLNHDIEFYNSDSTLIASLNPETGKITLISGATQQFAIQADIAQHIPRLQLYDTINNITMFSLTPLVRESTLFAQSPYRVEQLGDEYGSFAQGSCIMDSHNTCVILKDSVGNIVIPSPYHTQLKVVDYHFSDPKTTQFTISTQNNLPVGGFTFTARFP